MNETLSQFLLLGTGWLNGIFLGWFILGRKKQIKQEGSSGKNVGQVPPKRNPPPPLNVDPPPSKQVEHEPVAYLYRYRDGWTSQLRFNDSEPMEVQKLYTAPPKREWVGLTEEEIANIANACRWSIKYHADFAFAIESALKEKNHD